MFLCEFCEISKNTFFTEHLSATASVKCKMKVNQSLQIEINSDLMIWLY